MLVLADPDGIVAHHPAIALAPIFGQLAAAPVAMRICGDCRVHFLCWHI